MSSMRCDVNIKSSCRRFVEPSGISASTSGVFIPLVHHEMLTDGKHVFVEAAGIKDVINASRPDLREFEPSDQLAAAS
jgi:hypothetical protein